MSSILTARDGLEPERRQDGSDGAKDCSQRCAEMLVGERVPDVSQIEHETGDGAFAFHVRDVRFADHFTTGAIDLNGLRPRIDEPAQLRALFEILPHLVPEGLQPVAIGFDLDHEVGAEVPERFAGTLAQLPDPALERPGKRRRLRTSWLQFTPTGEAKTRLAVGR